MRRILALAVLCSLCASSTPAFAAHFALVGVFNKTTATDSSSNTWSPNGLGMGGGALLELSGLEIGALYSQRKFQRDDGTTTTNVGLNGIEVPVGLRFWMANTVSIGFGGYYSHYMSSSTVTYVSDASGQNTGTGSVTGDDIGAYGSLQIRLPLSVATGILIDGRYNYGFKRSSGDVEAKADDLQGLVGLVFGL